MTEAEDREVFAIFYLPAFADRYFLEGRLPFRHDAFAAGITDDEGVVIRVELGRIKQVTQLAFIHRRTDDEIRDTAHISDIVGAMMRGPVLAYQPCPVETENDGQVLDGHIMNHLVVRSLHERRVDIAIYPHPLRSHAGAEGHCMLFTNANVKGAIRHLFH